MDHDEAVGDLDPSVEIELLQAEVKRLRIELARLREELQRSRRDHHEVPPHHL